MESIKSTRSTINLAVRIWEGGRGGGDAWTNYRGNSSEQHSTTAAAAGTIHWEQCKYCHFWYLQGVTINFDFAVFVRIEGQVLPLVDFVLLLPSRKWKCNEYAHTHSIHFNSLCTHITLEFTVSDVWLLPSSDLRRVRLLETRLVHGSEIE